MMVRVELCRRGLGLVGARACWGLRGNQKFSISLPFKSVESNSPSISLCSYTKPLLIEGLAANGQAHASKFQVPIACRKLEKMPMSHGNSWCSMRTFVPSGPSSWPPRTRARRSSAWWRSTSQLSIVVMLRARPQIERPRRRTRPKSTRPFTTTRMKRWESWRALGPRY
jgi:hypothetical protein